MDIESGNYKDWMLKDPEEESGLLYTFETMQEHMPYLSQQKGEPVYENMDVVRVRFRGGNDKNITVTRITDDELIKHPRMRVEYLAWKDGRPKDSGGTPLALISSPAIVEKYGKFHVFTIEDLAQVTDNNLYNLGMGARELRARAIDYIRNHKGAIESAKENEMLRNRIDELEKMVAQVQEAQSAKLSVQPKKSMIRAIEDQTAP